jgi:hypothetical protein
MKRRSRASRNPWCAGSIEGAPAGETEVPTADDASVAPAGGMFALDLPRVPRSAFAARSTRGYTPRPRRGRIHDPTEIGSSTSIRLASECRVFSSPRPFNPFLSPRCQQTHLHSEKRLVCRYFASHNSFSAPTMVNRRMRRHLFVRLSCADCPAFVPVELGCDWFAHRRIEVC